MQRASSSHRLDRESLKRLQQQQQQQDTAKTAKRKGLKPQKSKSEPLSRDSQHLDEAFVRNHKRTKLDSDDNYQNSILEELDLNESQSSLQALLRHSSQLKERNQQLLRDIVDERNATAAAAAGDNNSESPVLSHKDEDEAGARGGGGGNTSARSQLSLTISRQSSGDSDRSYSRSVVIRSQQDHHHHHHHSGLKTSKKLEQYVSMLGSFCWAAGLACDMIFCPPGFEKYRMFIHSYLFCLNVFM